jgi:hypothetical protein
MPHTEELATGIELVRARIERQGKLKVSQTYKFPDRRVHYFLVTSDKKEVDFVLTEEFLTDLPGTRDYQEFLDEYGGALEHRFQQPDPLTFYCKSGTAFKLNIFWPVQQYVNRAATYVIAQVEDLRTPTLIAKCAVLFGMGSTHDMNPFNRQRTVVNSIREAIDRQTVTFYGTSAHPQEFQQIESWSMKESGVRTRESEIEQFISGKVYWLGFRQKPRDAKVWIADPWDARYLGVETAALRRAAQIQQARDVLNVDDDDCALAGKALLIGSSQFESAPTSQLALFGGDLQREKGLRQLLSQLLPSTVTVLVPGDKPLVGMANDIRLLIDRSDFVIFDVSSDNPNIFFQIGYAQALKKKVLLLVPKGYAQKLPFEIASVLYLAYDPENLGAVKDDLANYIQRFWGLVVRRSQNA